MSANRGRAHHNAMASTQLHPPIFGHSTKLKNMRLSATADGLMYEETTIRPHRYAKPRVDSIPSSDIMSSLYGRGHTFKAPTLEALAIREIFKNVEFITPEILDNIPWIIGKKVWRAAQSCGGGTLSLWRVFAPVYHEEESFSYFRVNQLRPEQSIQGHFADITDARFRWLTCLTISIPDVALADMMAISNIHNLVALDVCGLTLGSREVTSYHLVTDQVIRNWGRRAQECDDCFTQLRVLILRNQVDVTGRVFQFLDMFPSLVIFGVQGCMITPDIEPLAAQHGWTCADDSGLLKRMQRGIDCSDTWDGAIRSCVELSEDLITCEAIEALPSTKPPLLNYKLGLTTNDILVSTPLMLFRNLKVASSSLSSRRPRRAGTPVAEALSFFTTKNHYSTPSASASATPSSANIILNSNRTKTPHIPTSVTNPYAFLDDDMSTSPCPSTSDGRDPRGQRSSSKRRKVRESKLVDLNDWLDTVNGTHNAHTGRGNIVMAATHNNDDNGQPSGMGTTDGGSTTDLFMKSTDIVRNQSRSH